MVATRQTIGVRAVSEEGLRTTFELLTTTNNEASVRVLVASLESESARIRDESLRAILKRRSPSGHREIIRRLHTIDDHWRDIIREHRGRMTPTLRDALLGSDRQMCENGCRAAIMFREYDLIPALITAIEDQYNPHAEMVGKTLLELVETLYAALAGPRDYTDRRDPQLIRNHVLTSLESSLQRYGVHGRREIIEAFLLLVNRDNAILKRVLSDPHHAAFLTLIDFLSNSPRPGVIRLLLGFLDDQHPPSASLSILAKRCDPKFIKYLLRKIGREPSASAQPNLKRIESIRWLTDDLAVLDQLDDVAQHGAVTLTMSCGIPMADAYTVVEHILRHGKPAGRRAAATALAQFNGDAANRLSLDMLDDSDPRVQANVIAQLRHRGIPGVLSRLIEKVDSPHAVVREAVRESLAEFSFKRFLGAFDMLDEDVRRSTGMLVKRIDSRTVPQLKAEIESPVRTRRLRALAVARSIEVTRQLEETVIAALGDEDHMVRVEAATTLAQCDSPASLEALKEALTDSSHAVRETARGSIQQRAQFSQWRKTLADPRD